MQRSAVRPAPDGRTAWIERLTPKLAEQAAGIGLGDGRALSVAIRRASDRLAMRLLRGDEGETAASIKMRLRLGLSA